jgi:hypothetical protein
LIYSARLVGGVLDIASRRQVKTIIGIDRRHYDQEDSQRILGSGAWQEDRIKAYDDSISFIEEQYPEYFYCDHDARVVGTQ